MVVGLGKYTLSVVRSLLNKSLGESKKSSVGHLPLFTSSVSPPTSIGYVKKKSISPSDCEWSISQIEFFQMNLAVRNKNYLDPFSRTCLEIVLLIWPQNWCMAPFSPLIYVSLGEKRGGALGWVVACAGQRVFNFTLDSAVNQSLVLMFVICHGKERNMPWRIAKSVQSI